MEPGKTPNYFIRTLVVSLCTLLAVMLGYNFFLIEPIGEINIELILLIGILTVIVLSESFDNFSMGKFIGMSRGNKSDIGVQEASEKEQKANEEEIQKSISEANSTKDQARKKILRLDHKKIKELTLDKFIISRNFENFNLIKEAKLVTQFHGIDNISNIQPIFNGYININTGEEEIFIEVLSSYSYLYLMRRDRIYIMLNKILQYRSVKKSNAFLCLVIANIPKDIIARGPINDTENLKILKEYFEPAISSRILRIEQLELSLEEAKLCERVVTKTNSF